MNYSMWPFELLLAIYLVKIAGYFLLMRRKNRKGKDLRPVYRKNAPAVDIVLPMYNEEKVVVSTITNLLEIKYSNFSIIVVDDGSTDGSFEIVQQHFGSHPKVHLVRQQNAGKSAALNKGMAVSRGEIIVSIDADTWVRPDAIENIVAYFDHDNVAAVAGHIKVGNRVNLLTDMQYFEYIAIWDNDREISDPVNGILIVPGCLGAFRRSIVQKVGGFKSEVIAEDTELTLRLIYNNYVIRNATDAVAYTEAPDNLKMFFRQRVRWTTGLTQGLVKHNKRLFSHSNKFLTFLILPFTWAFRVILPFFLPMLDYYFCFAFFILKEYAFLGGWLAVILTEALTNLFLLRKYKERVSFFKLLVVQRLYRHLLFCNYLLIFSKGVSGTLFHWRKIARKGNVSLGNEAAK